MCLPTPPFLPSRYRMHSPFRPFVTSNSGADSNSLTLFWAASRAPWGSHIWRPSKNSQPCFRKGEALEHLSVGMRKFQLSCPWFHPIRSRPWHRCHIELKKTHSSNHRGANQTKEQSVTCLATLRSCFSDRASIRWRFNKYSSVSFPPTTRQPTCCKGSSFRSGLYQETTFEPSHDSAKGDHVCYCREKPARQKGYAAWNCMICHHLFQPNCINARFQHMKAYWKARYVRILLITIWHHWGVAGSLYLPWRQRFLPDRQLSLSQSQHRKDPPTADPCTIQQQ